MKFKHFARAFAPIVGIALAAAPAFAQAAPGQAKPAPPAAEEVEAALARIERSAAFRTSPRHRCH